MSVFLSYARDDKSKIRKVIRELKSKGIVTPYDAIIDPPEIVDVGANWSGDVREAIARASKFVVVWSAAAGASGWVNYETGMADALGKAILVAVPKGAAARIPANLRERQVIELDSIQ
jgi:hypothetical protein